MYKSFRVKNFRCFKDLQINDLGRVNLIAGKNNTGKTALLEAMYVLTRPQTPRTIFELQSMRGLKLPQAYMSNYWKHLFYNSDATETIAFQAERDAGPTLYLSVKELCDTAENTEAIDEYIIRAERSNSVNELHSSFQEPAAILEFSFKWTQAGETHKAYLGPDLLNDMIKEYEDSSSFIPVQGRPHPSSVKEQFDRIEKNGNIPNVIAQLQIFDKRIRDLRLLSSHGEPVYWVEIGWGNKPLPLKALGEGVNRVCHFMMTMLDEDLGYLFIDEIENGIHHSVQCKVWKAIGQVAREQDIQVFATTHSLGNDPKRQTKPSKTMKNDDFRYHRLDRDSTTGNIEAVTYNEFGMDAVSGVRIRA